LAEFSTVTLLYTARLHGNLGLLPSLFTLIQRERRSAQGPVFLLDLGDTCSSESWICRATYGRAPFLVLDGMGYDAAVIGGPERVPIPPPSLRRLVGQMIMPLLIWNRMLRLTRRGITIAVAAGNAPLPDGEPGIRIARVSSPLATEGDTGIILGDVPQGHLARVDINWPAWTVEGVRLLDVSPEIPPDPTVAALVEFVEDEAQSYGDQQAGDSAPD
jgi:2',3'-cyclic-nucleotide 2'-phosphodiesterase (5'-nucleotidase family)